MTNKKYKKYLSSATIFFIFFILALPIATLAAADTIPAGNSSCGGNNFCLNVPIGNVTGFNIGPEENPLAGYIKVWYGFMLGTVGILATVMIMWGGFKYLASRGDKAMIDSAKTQIISAITGVVLAFGTYTILNLINPALLTISMPGLNPVTGGENVILAANSKYATADPNTQTCAIPSNGKYNLSNYNPADCNYPTTLLNTAGQINIKNISDAQEYIKQKSPHSPITGEMVMSTANTYHVEPELLLSIMQHESNFADPVQRKGGVGARTFNPGNVGNWPDHETNLGTWQNGVNAIGAWLDKHKK